VFCTVSGAEKRGEEDAKTLFGKNFEKRGCKSRGKTKKFLKIQKCKKKTNQLVTPFRTCK